MKAATTFRRRTAFVLLTLCLAAVSSNALQRDDDSQTGRVYVLTNSATDNTVVVMERAADGNLVQKAEVSTGGLGSGLLPGAPPIGGPNPLDSQDALIESPDGRFLLAVNAGSNEVSVLAITEDGLRLVSKTSSNGEYPVSLAAHDNLIYVLNSHGNPNINGFWLDFTGKLHPIPQSTRSAGAPTAAPAEVTFSPDGKVLIVTERLANLIDVFRMNDEGTPGTHTQLASNHPTPFGVAFGRHHTIAITNTDEAEPRIPAPNAATVSTYRITDDTLEPISVAVPDNQSAACWIQITPDGRFAYVSNTGSGTISSFRLSPDGELTLDTELAADTGGPKSVPVDMSMTPNGKFLYVLSSLIGTVQGYQIAPDGSLTPFLSVTGFPTTVQGIVAR
jgi:6-phosphogluconolactonase